MNRRRLTGQLFTIAAVIATAAGCGGEPTSAPSTTPAWHVVDGALRDAQGRVAVLRGVNVANAHKEKPYFGFHGEVDIARIRDAWGMSAIRLLVSWAAIEPEKGSYDAAYLDEVARRVEWAEAANLVVIVDMHQDVYGEGFGGDGAPRWTCDAAEYASFEPAASWLLNYLNENVIACYDHFWASAELRDHYAEAWRRVAARLVDHPAVIGFDVMNEPYGGSQSFALFEQSTLEAFYTDVVRTVRSAAPGWIAFLEPAASRNLGIPTSLEPFSFADVVYAPHSYDASAEQGNGFDPSRRDPVMQNAEALREEATRLGADLWIGEYGGTSSSPGIADYLDAECDAAAAARAGAMIWSYDRDDGYGLLDPNGAEKAAVVDVVVRPSPERVAGEVVDFAFDDRSRTFTLRWHPNRAIAAPTVISVPARAYPNGYRAQCDGCELARTTGLLRVTRAPSDVATLTITP